MIRRQRYRIVKTIDHNERISGGWSEDVGDLNNSFVRHYCHYELENGTQVTVFETEDEQTFMQGYFG